MATFIWKITDVASNKSDGYVYHVEWYLEAWENSDRSGISGTKYGGIDLPKPSSGMIPIDSLTESQVITWVKDKLGSSKVTELETSLQTEIDNFQNISQNVTETSNVRPWDKSGSESKINSESP